MSPPGSCKSLEARDLLKASQSKWEKSAFTQNLRQKVTGTAFPRAQSGEACQEM